MAKRPPIRYVKAVARILAELQRAVMNRAALLAIEKEHATGAGIFRIAYLALFNDYVAHAMKVFEQSTRVASLWYLYRSDQTLLDAFAAGAKIDLRKLTEVSCKLKHIRDKTHFHIDADAVLATGEVWREAGITGRQLSTAIDQAWKLVCHLQQHHGLEAVHLLPEMSTERMRKQVARALN